MTVKSSIVQYTIWSQQGVRPCATTLACDSTPPPFMIDSFFALNQRVRGTQASLSLASPVLFPDGEFFFV